MDPKSIWNEEQNKPSLVVDDLEAHASRDVIYEVLLRRGVFKWLSARRKLIKLKDAWRDRVTASIERQQDLTGPSVNYERGYRRAIQECRAEVREICHGPRWDCPDNDSRAREWLRQYGARED